MVIGGREMCVGLSLWMTMMAAGCRNHHPELHPVKGRVLYLDDPVTDAVVAFYNDQSLRAATGRTDAQGGFHLSTFQDNDGTVAGVHTVTVTKTIAPVDDSRLSMDEALVTARPPVKSRQVLPRRYASVDTSPLRCTVTEDGPNDLVIELSDSK